MAISPESGIGKFFAKRKEEQPVSDITYTTFEAGTPTRLVLDEQGNLVRQKVNSWGIEYERFSPGEKTVPQSKAEIKIIETTPITPTVPPKKNGNQYALNNASEKERQNLALITEIRPQNPAMAAYSLQESDIRPANDPLRLQRRRNTHTRTNRVRNEEEFRQAENYELIDSTTTQRRTSNYDLIDPTLADYTLHPVRGEDKLKYTLFPAENLGVKMTQFDLVDEKPEVKKPDPVEASFTLQAKKDPVYETTPITVIRTNEDIDNLNKHRLVPIENGPTLSEKTAAKINQMISTLQNSESRGVFTRRLAMAGVTAVFLLGLATNFVRPEPTVQAATYHTEGITQVVDIPDHVIDAAYNAALVNQPSVLNQINNQEVQPQEQTVNKTQPKETVETRENNNPIPDEGITDKPATVIVITDDADRVSPAPYKRPVAQTTVVNHPEAPIRPAIKPVKKTQTIVSAVAENDKKPPLVAIAPKMQPTHDVKSAFVGAPEIVMKMPKMQVAETVTNTVTENQKGPELANFVRPEDGMFHLEDYVSQEDAMIGDINLAKVKNVTIKFSDGTSFDVPITQVKDLNTQNIIPQGGTTLSVTRIDDTLVFFSHSSAKNSIGEYLRNRDQGNRQEGFLTTNETNNVLQEQIEQGFTMTVEADGKTVTLPVSGGEYYDDPSGDKQYGLDHELWGKMLSDIKKEGGPQVKFVTCAIGAGPAIDHLFEVFGNNPDIQKAVAAISTARNEAANTQNQTQKQEKLADMSQAVVDLYYKIAEKNQDEADKFLLSYWNAEMKNDQLRFLTLQESNARRFNYYSQDKLLYSFKTPSVQMAYSSNIALP